MIYKKGFDDIRSRILLSSGVGKHREEAGMHRLERNETIVEMLL